MSSSTIDERIRVWAGARRLPDAWLARWLALRESDRNALLETAEVLRLRTGQLIVAFELVEEIAVREQQQICNILGSAEIRRIIESAASAPGRAHDLIECLRAIRFPRLKEVNDRIAAEVAALTLPRGVNVILPRDLSSDELRIEIVAHDADETGELIEAVARNRASLARIARMLSGTDEI